MDPIRFTCDISQHPDPFDHFFEHTIGSDHATMALRADWQKQLVRCQKEIGFQYVRFHGILSDDMGTLMDEINQFVYSFFNADQVFDFLLSIGMRPFVELSFMPSCLSSGDRTVFHYKGNVTPPRDYAQWATLISKLVRHWVERYGIEETTKWFFEVWNEPNLPDFWTGTQADYFRLYQVTAAAIKQIDPGLMVGGPATANNAWIPDFLAFNEKNQVPVDFISTHHYPTDAFGQPGDDTATQLAKSRRSVLHEQALQANKDAKSKPLYYTEWSSSSNPFDELHDRPYCAAFIVKTIMEARGLVKGYSYWTFSDIFEENYFNSSPFHGGFGLLNIYGVPKPAYRAYQLLHHLGDKIFEVEGGHPTVDVWVIQKDNTIQVLLTNWTLPMHLIDTQVIALQLTINKKVSTAYIERIDDQHTNTRSAWEKMGMPYSLSKQQVIALEKVSELVQEPLNFSQVADVLSLSIEMPPQSVACITLN